MSDIPLAYRRHDHSRCIRSALNTAEQLCKRNNLRLTVIRRQVLEIIWQNHNPLGAYSIMEQLSTAEGKHAAPPTVYRALDFLLENGLIHQLASINAFTGCNHPQLPHQSCFLICQQCGTVIELEQPAVDQPLQQACDTLGFIAQNRMVEVTGICRLCRKTAHD